MLLLIRRLRELHLHERRWRWCGVAVVRRLTPSRSVIQGGRAVPWRLRHGRCRARCAVPLRRRRPLTPPWHSLVCSSVALAVPHVVLPVLPACIHSLGWRRADIWHGALLIALGVRRRSAVPLVLLSAFAQ